MKRYENFTTMSLIRTAQKCGKKLDDPTFLKVASSQDKAGFKRELSQVRHELSERMKLFDRSRPDFFPLDVLIIYKKADERSLEDFTEGPGRAEREGVVVAREEKHVVILLEGDENLIKVDPEDLTLKYLS